MIRYIGHLCMLALALVIGVPLIGAAVICSRLLKNTGESKLPRLLFGPTPVISISLIAAAARVKGYSAMTLVDEVYHINRRGDFSATYLDLAPMRWLPTCLAPLLARYMGPYIATAYAIFNFDILHIFFTGGFLQLTPLRYLEAVILRLGRVKIIVMPYGADNAVPSQTDSLLWRHGLMASYPQIGKNEERTLRRIRYWSLYANHMVGCLFHCETMPRWDTLTIHYYPVDTDRWLAAPQHLERNGVVEEVLVGHSPNHRTIKGTQHIIDAVNKLRQEGIRIRLVLMERIPNEEVMVHLANCDILVEQLYQGYALSAMEGMALGRPVISNLEDGKICGIHRLLNGLDQCPIVSTGPGGLVDHLRTLTLNPVRRCELGQQGREYIMKFHSIQAAGAFWDPIWQHVSGIAPVARQQLMSWHPDKPWPNINEVA